MTCHNCARHVTEALRSVPGVERATVDLSKATASVRWNAGHPPEPPRLLAAVEEAGYTAKIHENNASAKSSWLWSGWHFNVIFGSLITAALMALEWGFGAGPQRWYHWFSLALVLPIQAIGGSKFYLGAWRQLKSGQSNMDTLVSLGSTTAFLYSLWGLLSGWSGHLYFMDAAAIITLVSVGHFLEEKASAQAASSLRALLHLTPEMARRQQNGVQELVPVANLLVGDEVLLRAGDRIPTDGDVLTGDSAVNEAMLTGESLPVDKSPGSKVYAGTLNENGILTIRVTATGESTALARIIEIVQQAQSSRAHIQRLGDRVSSVFVPIVILIAIVTALWWALAPDIAARVHSALSAWLWRGHFPSSPGAAAIFHTAAVLIIACPCAMGLATPIAIMAGTNAAARKGILIRDGIALEKTGKINTVVFDKTGTLTEGKLSVAAVEEFSPASAQAASSLARHSSHPLSQAIAACDNGTSSFTRVSEQRGSGVQGFNGDESCRLGSLRWLAENKVDTAPAKKFTELWSAQGATLVGFSQGSTLVALFALKDALKPQAAEVVARLTAAGQTVYLLTGDNRRTAEAIAAQAGIPASNVRAEVRPEGKVEFLRELQARGAHTAFVGDGINDAPALHQADLGIALLSASDVARESADIVLLNAGLDAIPEALHLAQRTLRTIKQNLFWAFFYNALGVPLAALGFLSPIFSAFAMGMSDLIVVGNALRLRFR